MGPASDVSATGRNEGNEKDPAGEVSFAPNPKISAGNRLKYSEPALGFSSTTSGERLGSRNVGVSRHASFQDTANASSTPTETREVIINCFSKYSIHYTEKQIRMGMTVCNKSYAQQFAGIVSKQHKVFVKETAHPHLGA